MNPVAFISIQNKSYWVMFIRLVPSALFTVNVCCSKFHYCCLLLSQCLSVMPKLHSYSLISASPGGETSFPHNLMKLTKCHLLNG